MIQPSSFASAIIFAFITLGVIVVIINDLRGPKEQTLPDDKWLPIETAPVDGTEITAGWNNCFHSEKTGTPICWQIEKAHPDGGGWFALSPDTYHETLRLGDYTGKWLRKIDYPTHWKPLIKPPKKNNHE